MKKQTAAEKFDLVPPWCVAVCCPSRTCRAEHTGESLMCNDRGHWDAIRGPMGNFYDEAKCRAAARLTRPLDSWEPAWDAPMPVLGWHVKEHSLGRVAVYDANGMYAGLECCTFPTRRAAYVWAWTEAPAPGEAQHTDGTGAKDGQSDDRGTLGWAAFDQLAKAVDDCEVLVTECDAKVDGILARLGPVTDGKGRTLAERDREIDQFAADFRAFRSMIAHDIDSLKRWSADDRMEIAKAEATADALDKRLTIVERLVAAKVPAITPGRNDAAAENALATDVAGADEGAGRRVRIPEQRARRRTDGSAIRSPKTSVWREGHQLCLRTASGHSVRHSASTFAHAIAPLVRPAKPAADHVLEAGKKVDGFRDTAAVNADTLNGYDAACQAVPSTYRVGDDLAAWVRNLAMCHQQALTKQEEYRRALVTANDNWEQVKAQLATAHEATRQAEARAATATKRATAAEAELADLRERLEKALAAT